MTRLLLSVAALLALTSVDALAGEKKLTGTEIKAAYSDARSTFKTTQRTFLIDWKADGTMKGKEETGVWFYADHGKWWVKGDTFCRKWEISWGGRREECFGVALDGNKVKWLRADGSDMYPSSPMILTK